jgi:poly(3-hydroxybutyrate) depolymerase
VPMRGLAALACALAAAGCGGGHSSPQAAKSSPRCTERLPLHTFLNVPAGPRQPRTLLLALHGTHQNGANFSTYSRFALAARDFVVAFPSTPHADGSWRVEDVPQLLALADAVGRCLPIRDTVVLGFSNGGLMANALACHAADRIRAVALVAPGYRGLGRCGPARPVSILAIAGERDLVVPYRGLRAFIGEWARRDGCSPTPHASRGDFETDVEWHGCRGVRVRLVRVDDDTHGWPALEDANQRIAAFLR